MVFMIILEYKNWAVNICNIALMILHVGTSDIVWHVDYSIGLSLYNCDVQLPNNSDGEVSLAPTECGYIIVATGWHRWPNLSHINVT
jgi:hypothetical protein